MDLVPNYITLRALEYIDSGDALDLGCGNGEDSAFLALKGFKVTAIDSYSFSIHNSLQLAKINGVSIDAFNLDIRALDFIKSYDLILCNNVLHFLDSGVFEFIRNIKDKTKREGINVISSFSSEGGSKQYSFLFGPGELREIYSDWEILHYKESHGEVEIIARKPGKGFEAY